MFWLARAGGRVTGEQALTSEEAAETLSEHCNTGTRCATAVTAPLLYLLQHWHSLRHCSDYTTAVLTATLAFVALLQHSLQ